jgi:N utilization substance protein B
VGSRSKSRRKAAEVLYEADIRGESISSTLARVLAQGLGTYNEFTIALIEGISTNLATIDDVINTYSEGWRTERMPSLDKALARIGTFELLYSQDIPDEATISEIVTLAGDMSTEQSPPFLNGLLAKISSVRHRIVL